MKVYTAQISSCRKYHLKRMLHEQTLTFDAERSSGEPLTSVPTDRAEQQNFTSRSRFYHFQKMAQVFQSRRSKDYLHILQQKGKWNIPTPNIKVGDLVVMRDCDLFLNQWPMTRVVAVHPSKDGLLP